MPPNGKCVFNIAWLEIEEYKEWIIQGPDRYKAKCCICSKIFDVSAMGESAIKSHMKGQKHNNLLKAKQKNTTSITEYLKAPGTSIPEESSSTPLSPLIDSFALKKDVLEAEILWILKCVQNHFSFHSCAHLGETFKKMFPDSSIAKQFSCAETKARYLCHFGIAPYFENEIIKLLKDVTHFTLLFDETLNATNQRKQMDIHVRLWSGSKVRTQYLTSIFLGHSTSDDLLKAFYEATIKIDLNKLVHISMDGPAVNWKFYEKLQANLKKDMNIQCITIGSCGLHIMNNAFKKGVVSTKWNVTDILSALYWFFKDSPARREDYMEVSETKKFPKKFCGHRWLENTPAAERALEIWNDLINYFNQIEKGKFPKPTSKSFSVIMDAVKDSSIEIKFNVFLSVSNVIKPFLELYQTDKPMLPFLGQDTLKVVCNLLKLFKVVKPAGIDKISNVKKLVDFDFEDSSLHEPKDKISLGFTADKILKEKLSKKKITEGNALLLKNDCKNLVLKLIQHLLEKCPITYSLVRNISCINPSVMVKSPEKAQRKMKHVLTYFSHINQISDENAEKILLLFIQFLDVVKKNLSVEFKNFDSKTMGIDEFFSSYMKEEKYAQLFEFIKMLLILSHGQASVERGFSVNKAMEVENLKEESYVAQRIIYDHLKIHGGVNNINITKELRLSASSARSKYQEYLERQRQEKLKGVIGVKRKSIEEKIEYLEKKRRCLEKDIVEHEKEAEELAQEGEAKNDISLFLKSNNLRKIIKEKNNQVEEIASQVTTKREDLKKL